MQAIELHANIDEKHQILLNVPEDWPAQKVKVIVLLETSTISKAEKRVFGQFRDKIQVADDFNAELPDTFWLGKEV